MKATLTERKDNHEDVDNNGQVLSSLSQTTDAEQVGESENSTTTTTAELDTSSVIVGTAEVVNEEL